MPRYHLKENTCPQHYVDHNTCYPSSDIMAKTLNYPIIRDTELLHKNLEKVMEPDYLAF